MVAKKHKFWTWRKKIFTLGAVSSLGLVVILAASARCSIDERELHTLRQQQRVNKDVAKVKQYVMYKEPRVWPSLAEEIAVAEVNAANTYKVPLDLLVGIHAKEGNMYPFAMSRTGAAGGHQVDFAAHKEEIPIKYEWQKFEPNSNANAGAKILSESIRKYGLRKGLTVYNVGEGAFKKGKRNPKYVAEVFALSGEFRFFDYN